MPDPRESRVSQSAFRRGAGGMREPLAPPGGDHVHYTPLRRVGIGVITSRPASQQPPCRCWVCRLGFQVDHSKPKE